MNKFLKIAITAGLIIWAMVSIFKDQARVGDDMRNTLTYSHKIPDDYSDVLHLKHADTSNTDYSFSLIETLESKSRNPICYFIYQGKYFLQVYEVDSSFTGSLRKDLKTENSDSKSSSYPLFTEYSKSLISYNYRFSKPEKPDKLLLRLYGETNKLMENSDSIVCYFSKIKNFSLKINEQQPYDVYGETHRNWGFSTNLPLEVLFLKKKSKLFFLTMSVSKEDIGLVPGTLLEVINSK